MPGTAPGFRRDNPAERQRKAQMPTKRNREPTGGPNDGQAFWDTEVRRPIGDRRFFRFGQIARRLARLRGRAEVDEDEAYRVLNELIAWYERHEFAEDEVLVLVDDPPHFAALKPRLDEVEREYRREGRPILHFWRDGVLLTRPALRRYLERSTLIGAPRLLLEWFPNVISPTRTDAAAPPAPASPKRTTIAAVAKEQNAGAAKPKKRRRDETRSEILEALVVLDSKEDWKKSPNGVRCRSVERELNKPAGWCKMRTLGRAIADRARGLSK
jgi:hypothetical protein